ncbi:unnamed protein product [Discosporangium mesarthrocarpum]
MTRVEFALSHVSTKRGTGMVVDDMYKWVHVNERGFYVMRDRARIHLRPDDEVPTPPMSPSKRFFSKVTFLVAVARPRQMSNVASFDGKIGPADDMKTNPSPWTGNSRSS